MMSFPRIDPRSLFELPVAWQAEGLRLLEEMGKTRPQIARLVGLSRRDVDRLIDGDHEPIRRRTSEGDFA